MDEQATAEVHRLFREDDLLSQTTTLELENCRLTARLAIADLESFTGKVEGTLRRVTRQQAHRDQLMAQVLNAIQ